MKIRRTISRTISEFSALTHYMRKPKEGFRILMYHAVGTPAVDDKLGLFSITSGEFQSQMEFLVKFTKIRVVEFSEASLHSTGDRVSITFDDGYQDNLDIAAPILSSLGIPFTVFVISDFVRKKKQGFLSPSALRTLSDIPGAQIGSHGTTHLPLKHCDATTLRHELEYSKFYLEDVIGKNVCTLTYPHGSVSGRVRAAAMNAGFKLAACSRAGINDLGADRLSLSRTEILSCDDQRVFSQKLRGDWDWYRWRKLGQD